MGKVSTHSGYQFLNWGPHRFFVTNCTDIPELSHCNNDTASFNTSNLDFWKQDTELLTWLKRGLVSLRSQIILPNRLLGLQQWHLWKLPTAMSSICNWTGAALVWKLPNYPLKCYHILQVCIELP